MLRELKLSMSPMSLLEGCNPIRHGGGKILNILRRDISRLLENGLVELGSSSWMGAKLHYMTLKQAPNTFDRAHVRRAGRPREKVVSKPKLLHCCLSKTRAMGRGVILLKIDVTRICLSG